jgi:hypothetical protein
MRKLCIKDRMIRSIALRKGEVLLRADFDRMGSASQVSRALKMVVSDGKLVRLGYGTYAKAQPSPLSGKPIPRQPLEALAWEAMERLGVKINLGKALNDYATGNTNQIPMSTTFNTGDRRISRKLVLGNRSVVYENNY